MSSFMRFSICASYCTLSNNDALAMKWVMVNMAISAVVLLAVNMLEKRDFLTVGGRRAAK